MGLNVLSAIHGMSAIWDVSYWEALLYFEERFSFVELFEI